MTPLLSINGTKFSSFFVCPLVPDRYATFLKPTHVGLTAQKPEQFINDGTQVQFLGRECGEILPQIKPRLRAENGKRARAGAVGLKLAVIEDMPEQIEGKI